LADGVPILSSAMVHLLLTGAGRLALAGGVLAVAWCCLHVKRLHGVRPRVLEAAAFAGAVVVGIVVPDLTLAALAVLTLLVAAVSATAATAAR